MTDKEWDDFVARMRLLDAGNDISSEAQRFAESEIVHLSPRDASERGEMLAALKVAFEAGRRWERTRHACPVRIRNGQGGWVACELPDGHPGHCRQGTFVLTFFEIPADQRVEWMRMYEKNFGYFG